MILLKRHRHLVTLVLFDKPSSFAPWAQDQAKARRAPPLLGAAAAGRAHRGQGRRRCHQGEPLALRMRRRCELSFSRREFFLILIVTPGAPIKVTPQPLYPGAVCCCWPSLRTHLAAAPWRLLRTHRRRKLVQRLSARAHRFGRISEGAAFAHVVAARPHCSYSRS